ncbi:MAG: cell division protein FtsA [Nitrospinae bacterium]|nr:cell division protein FtsA [Nitrospinota bacterium]
MAKNRELIAGLDIGTSKTCCVLADISGGAIDIVGLGSHASHGLRKGVVVNIESTVESIKAAVEEAETMAGAEIESVYASVAGEHIKGINSHGIIAVKGSEVTQADVDRVLEAAKAVNIPMDREMIHTLSQEFIVDEQGGVAKPVGMRGVRLEAKVHIITGSVTWIQNIVRSVNRAGLVVSATVAEQLAASEAALDEDEKELGVALVNMGGGTCDIAIYHKGSIKWTSVVTLGGNDITGDISIGFRTPGHEAEKIKRLYGCAASDLVPDDEVIDVPGVGEREARQVYRRTLADIIQPRVEEIFMMVKRDLEVSGYLDQLAAGLALTGGTAMMQGMPEIAEAIFNMPVRRAHPRKLGGITDIVDSAEYATAVGLILYGARDMASGRKRRSRGKGALDGGLVKIKDWIKDFF